MTRIYLIGLEEPEVQVLLDRIHTPILHTEILPRMKLVEGELLVEHPEIYERFVPVTHVVYHGIYDNDLTTLATLALWNGPCFPNPLGMLDCRQRIPCLIRALQVTRFGTMKRGLAPGGMNYSTEAELVAKWGEWHCGENKARFAGERKCDETTLIEPFVAGESVRIQLIGDQAWQVRMRGEDWLKSIHHGESTLSEIDEELLEDTRELQTRFGLEIIAVDYQIADDGTKHLLEVNHIPSVTAFAEMREAYLDYVTTWLQESLS